GSDRRNANEGRSLRRNLLDKLGSQRFRLDQLDSPLAEVQQSAKHLQREQVGLIAPWTSDDRQRRRRRGMLLRTIFRFLSLQTIAGREFLLCRIVHDRPRERLNEQLVVIANGIVGMVSFRLSQCWNQDRVVNRIGTSLLLRLLDDISCLVLIARKQALIEAN